MQEKRAEKNITQREAALAVGITEGYYSMIEAGERQKKMDFSLVCKLANLFDMSLEDVAKAEMHLQ